jgi:hypothetical protein
MDVLERLVLWQRFMDVSERLVLWQRFMDVSEGNTASISRAKEQAKHVACLTFFDPGDEYCASWSCLKGY